MNVRRNIGFGEMVMPPSGEQPALMVNQIAREDCGCMVAFGHKLTPAVLAAAARAVGDDDAIGQVHREAAAVAFAACDAHRERMRRVARRYIDSLAVPLEREALDVAIEVWESEIAAEH